MGLRGYFYLHIFLIAIGAYVAICVIASGCVKSTRPAKNETASYYLAQFPSPTAAPIVTHTITGRRLPDQKRFYFKVCILSMAKSEPVRAHRFEITGIPRPQLPAQNLKTDSFGCLNWEETISFDPLTEPRFLALERTLHPAPGSIHRGTRTFKMAIHPWSGFNGNEPTDFVPLVFCQIVRGGAVGAVVKWR